MNNIFPIFKVEQHIIALVSRKATYSKFKFDIMIFLAHLSRRLIGELIVYTGIRRPIVRPSTFSNDISSEAVRPIFPILHTKHLQVGGTKSYVFYSGRMRTLVAMETYSSHRLIMGKV